MTREQEVTLVIPGRNCAATIGACLDAVVPLRERGELTEIIFVDDGSTDGTAGVVADYDVTCIEGTGQGAGAARNLGWRAANTPLVWFVDSDCVPRSDALSILLPHLGNDEVSAVSGSYDNLHPKSAIACLIHEEIRERHRRMPAEIDHVATFNVLYRRRLLDELGGFDERYLKAQDAELSFRALRHGAHLRFEDASRVGHFHEQHLFAYLRVQRQQGYWRVFLHLTHRGHAQRNAYSDALDHLQPPLAMLALAALPLLAVPGWSWLPFAPVLALLTTQLPMTSRLLTRLGDPRYLGFAPFGALRAFWRGVGMTQAVLDLALGRRRLSP